MKTDIKIDKMEIEDIIALTPMQLGMLFQYLKEPESEQYNEQLVLNIKGKIDIGFFKKAWNFVAQSNELLRTVFRWDKMNQPIQVILKKHVVNITFYDLSNKKTELKKQLVETIKKNDIKCKFDLQYVSFKVILCKLKECQYVIIISNHHILYDGWSTSIILKEFFENYNKLLNSKKLLKPIKNKFKNYVKWIQNRDKSNEEKYWKKYLKDLNNKSLFLYVQKTKTKVTSKIKEISNKFDIELTKKLIKFTSKKEITLATLFNSAWGILLQKYTNSHDVVFGTTVSGRHVNIKGIENMVGLFINTLPLRITCNNENFITNFLNDTNKLMIERRKYESSSLVNIKSYIDSNEILFDTVLVVENYPIDYIIKNNNKLKIESYYSCSQTNFDLILIIEIHNEIQFRLLYNSKLYDKKFIKSIFNHFLRIIIEITEKSNNKIKKINIFTKAEKNKLLYEFNTTNSHFPKNKTINEIFEDQVRKTPENIALVCRNKRLTYQELNERSNNLAKVLRSKGVKADTIVGIMTNRSVEMITGIFAILKAGGAYLPLSPELPKDRLEFILKDCKTYILLSQKKISNQIDIEIENIYLDNECIYYKKSNINGIINVSSDNIAYIIYTSGSTGKPKGVIVQHKSVINILYTLQKKYPFLENDSYLFKTNYTFDVSVTEVFGWFLGNGKLVILENELEKDPLSILQTIQKNKITHCNFTPSMLIVFINLYKETTKHSISSLKYIFIAGEVLPIHLVKELNILDSTIQFVNLYGPTEATVYSTVYSIDNRKYHKSIPIGKPIDNAKIFILDKANNPQPIGVPGELCISGIGVAKGYLNRTRLTKEKFVQNPFFPDKMYKTGDIARWSFDGNIEFLGRSDNQVKIRGFRIELGEIESQVLKYKYIKNVVVVARRDVNNNNNLCAYISSNKEISISRLRKYLSTQLPYYMIPTYFVKLDKIPLTPSGKVDTEALPDPSKNMRTADEKIEMPANKVEKDVEEIWKKILNINKIGMNKNFFELGGDSLKAIQIINLINKKMNVEITVKNLFDTLTVRELSLLISKTSKTEFIDIEAVKENDFYELSFNQKILWINCQINNRNTSYNIFGGIKMTHKVDEKSIKEALNKIIERHEILKTGFKLVGSKPAQFVKKHLELPFQTIDLSKFNNQERIHKKRQFLIQESKVYFELKYPPLFRVSLIKLDEEDFELVFNIHHIIFDGWSMKILENEFYFLYENYKYKQQKKINSLKIQYKDFVNWQTKRLKNQAFEEKARCFWLQKLKVDLPKIELPTDFIETKLNKEGAIYRYVMSENKKNRLKRIAKDNNTSLFMIFFAVYNILLSLLSGEKTIVCTVPVAGREHASLTNIIGFFVNPLILVNDINLEESFEEFLFRVNKNTLEAFEYQSYPIELVFENLHRKYPSVPVSFNMLNFNYNGVNTEYIYSEKSYFDIPKDVNYDLELYIEETKNGIEMYWRYRKYKFKSSTIEFFSNSYLKLLDEEC